MGNLFNFFEYSNCFINLLNIFAWVTPKSKAGLGSFSKFITPRKKNWYAYFVLQSLKVHEVISYASGFLSDLVTIFLISWIIKHILSKIESISSSFLIACIKDSVSVKTCLRISILTYISTRCSFLVLAPAWNFRISLCRSSMFDVVSFPCRFVYFSN